MLSHVAGERIAEPPRLDFSKCFAHLDTRPLDFVLDIGGLGRIVYRVPFFSHWLVSLRECMVSTGAMVFLRSAAMPDCASRNAARPMTAAVIAAASHGCTPSWTIRSTMPAVTVSS